MKKSGFTLIEMIIVLALTTVIVMLTGTIFTIGNRIFLDSDTRSTLQMDAEQIEQNISRNGLQSVRIENVEDESGNENINSDVRIVDATYEELIDHMEEIEGEEWLQINEMTIVPFVENGDNITTGIPVAILRYDRETRRLFTGNIELPGNVESVRIRPVDIEDSHENLRTTNSIIIRIELREGNVFNEFVYPVFVTIKFRNNFIRGNEIQTENVQNN